MYEPSSKLRPPLPRADRSLLRVWGRTLSVYADMPTMNIQISLKFHAVCAASKVLQNYNGLGLKEIKFVVVIFLSAGVDFMKLNVIVACSNK